MPLISQSPYPLPVDIGVIPDDFDVSTITPSDLIVAAIAVLAGMLLSLVAKKAVRRVLNRIDGMPLLAGDVIAKIVSYVILTLGGVVALEALGISFGLVGSALLLLIVLVVLAAKPLLQDLGAGLIVQLRRPFSIGDQVLIDGIEGAIDEVSARTVRIITVDGKRVHLPNRSVLEGAVTNLTTEGQRLTTFIVGAAYDTDLEHAREVIVAAMQSADAVLSDPSPQAFVDEFSDSTINIACRFWHAPEIEAEWVARDEAMRAVKRSLDANGIKIAFPQRVLWTGGASD
ncbi:MAG: small-conductance mechanosensitive channel [Ilumatobacter sp.]|jgi:small-conductance mechanosensitive channel